MAPSKAPTSWEDEESSSGESAQAGPVVARRSKFDDEEEDSDVLESWDAAEDSEAEREKAKKAAESKAKAEAAAKASHKTKSQRIEEHRQAKMRQRQMEDEESSEEEEDEADRRARLRAEEKAGDMKHAEDLFANIGISNSRASAKSVTVQEDDDPNSAIDLTKLRVFQPKTAPEFTKMRETLVPLINDNSKKPQYPLFMPEFCKQICKDMTSEQIKKVSSALSTLSNEKLKEEKAADKGGKKTKAAKNKTSLVGDKGLGKSQADTTAFDDGLEDDDFM